MCVPLVDENIFMVALVAAYASQEHENILAYPLVPLGFGWV
jgi:hypothetical protein